MSQIFRLWVVLTILSMSIVVEQTSEAQAQSNSENWLIGIWENVVSESAQFKGVAFFPDGQIRISEMEGMIDVWRLLLDR